AASAIVIDDPEVSARHASVTRSGDAVRLKDLGSTNGTKVSGERSTSERKLEPGDRSSIGPATIQLDAGDAGTRTVVRTPPVATPVAGGAAVAKAAGVR